MDFPTAMSDAKSFLPKEQSWVTWPVPPFFIGADAVSTEDGVLQCTVIYLGQTSLKAYAKINRLDFKAGAAKLLKQAHIKYRAWGQGL